ncbi:MAG: tRNA modification GTPase [Bacteroidia bacterium]|jgi:tRNA modification GTPase
MTNFDDTIAAPATPAGVSAIAVVRLSGKDAIAVANKVFSKNIADAKGYTLHFGTIRNQDVVIDEVLLTVFRNPTSYTGEDSVEISCHGSPYITRRIIDVLTQNGARMAEPGEFTLRAFLNKKLDLAQAEAVADMIHSSSEAGLQMAISQMRGGFSSDIAALRQELIDFAALIELENDFGEEDVEFADRTRLTSLVETILLKINQLHSSFDSGNALKNGIATVLVGKPNSGKSTLLNALLNEERAIVSDIAGTTRDSIEEAFVLNGVQFRLIDTAGLRESEDVIEKIGVERTKNLMQKAELLIYLFDVKENSAEEVATEVYSLPKIKHVLMVGNKADDTIQPIGYPESTLFISAKNKDISTLLEALKTVAENYAFGNETMISNVRHAKALSDSSVALQAVLTAISTGLTGDLIALDIRQALFHLGLITGEVTTEDLLDSIFTRFCIGK